MSSTNPTGRGPRGTRAGEVLPPHPPWCPPRPVADPAHHARHRRILSSARSTPAAGCCSPTPPPSGCSPALTWIPIAAASHRGMAAGRLLVAVAHHRRPTALPAQDRRPAPVGTSHCPATWRAAEYTDPDTGAGMIHDPTPPR